MDMYEFNRQYNGGADPENYDYKIKPIPQMYPQMTPIPSMMPSIVPVPMMTIRPGAEMDYSRWMNGNYQQQYRNSFYDAHPYPSPRHQDSSHTHERKVYPEDLGDLSPQPNSPRFGPGPPIVTSDRVKGPRGCNLFVFHLPNEITNWDLYLLFRKFGTILSVHTMINKTTGLSKGYGFVSYAGREEAKAAIAAMDGFRLGKKRLKVQVKRSQDDLMEHDGEEEPEHDLDAEGVFDAAAFASGDTSAATTRASTPHGHQLHHQHAHTAPLQQQQQLHRSARSDSHCSSDSLMERADHGNTDDTATKREGEAQPANTTTTHAAHDRLVNSVASLSLAPVTPREAELQVKRDCAAAIAARSSAHSVPSTTTSTMTSSAHTGTTAAGSDSKASSPSMAEKTAKRVVGFDWYEDARGQVPMFTWKDT